MSGTPEGRVLRACLDYLRLCGIAAWRINTMGTPLANKPGRFRPAPSVGIADILGIARERVSNEPIPFAAEVKSKVGRQSPAQREFQAKWEAAGGVYLLVRSVDELRNGLREAGVEVR